MTGITLFSLISELEKMRKNGVNDSATVMVELSGDSDFEKVQGLTAFTVFDSDTGEHCPALDIGWGWKHTPHQQDREDEV